MGDRSNIVIEDYRPDFGTSRVYLYSHWDGQEVIGAAITGLTSDRANDVQYLARVVFDAMVGDDQGSPTGYGISAVMHDNEHPLIVISVRNEGTFVYFEDQADFGAPFEPVTKAIKAAEFVAMVESIEDWADLARSGTLYDGLITKVGKP